ncbi:phosphatidylglycerophosphatase A [Nitrosophilus alvini]|uniref:phosphatidylglycerophosphatase A family protein n=1 Tax=Nitrosophilus alvini TaxID=2714855 RepID=UPI00190B892C|nr:phosphatidylglycerophosphatase A [Nitrosophilus alvini]
MDFRKCFLTGCYSGLLPKAPGTWGSLFGLVTAFAILLFLPQSTLFLLSVLLTVIAIKEIDKYEKKTRRHDGSEIVIDEIAGIWIAVSILPDTSFVWLAFAFVFFRIFDVLKPSLIGKAEKRLKGGLAVMADDILAGFAAGISTGLVYVIYMKFF